MAAVSAEMHVRKRPGKAVMRPVREDTGPPPPPVERTSDALWPWAAPLPSRRAPGWLRTAGYLVDADRGGGLVRPPGSLGWILFSAMTSKGLRSAMGLDFAAVEAAAGKTP